MLVFQTIHIDDFHLYEDKLAELYLNSFTKGDNPQFLHKSDAKTALRNTLRKGAGILVTSDKQPVGLTLFHPLQLDADFPPEEKSPATKDSLYIAEVMVAESFRGRGIAKRMLEKTEEFALQQQFKTLMLRVWDKNTAALALYKKTHFVESGIQIFQLKYKDANKPFTMRKLYLHKEISSGRQAMEDKR